MAKALIGKTNPRYAVTSFSAEEIDARSLYKDLHRARGEVENRTKEQQIYLLADRTGTRSFKQLDPPVVLFGG